MRPRRKVITTERGYAVSPDDDRIYTDSTLAREVATELDRIDPLPCLHEDSDLFEITAISDSRRVYLRFCCGETVCE